MMKKFTLAALALLVSGSAFADIAGGTTTAITTPAATVAKAHTYKVSDKDREARLFVKNDFDLTLSANVQLMTNETARAMATGTVNTNGRNIFTGHSDGGSVSNCGEPLTAAEAKAVNGLTGALTARFEIDNNGGCKLATANDGGDDD